MAGRAQAQCSSSMPALKMITKLGEDPSEWLSALECLNNLENDDYKRVNLGRFFFHAHKKLNPADHSGKESYAILLGREALFHSETSKTQARNKFDSALSICHLPIIHLMYAQFELSSWNHSGAVKILRQAKENFGNYHELDIAIEKVNKGNYDICSKNVSACQKTMNPMTKQEPVESQNSVKTRNDVEKLLSNFSISTSLLGKEPEKPTSLLHAHRDAIHDHTSQTATRTFTKDLSLSALDLQSPAAPDLSIFSSEYKPSPTSRLLESAKHLQEQHESPVLKSIENRKMEQKDTSEIQKTEKISCKKFAGFSKGPQRVLRTQIDSDEDSPLKVQNSAKYNVDASVPPLKMPQLNVTRQDYKLPDVKKTPSAFQNRDLDGNKHHCVAFKPPQRLPVKPADIYCRNIDKENQCPPPFVNNCLKFEHSHIKAETRKAPPDFPPTGSKPKSLIGETVGYLTLNTNQSSSQRDVHHRIHTAAELMHDKKVLLVNGVEYVVLNLLGKGGSSKVYKVYDPKTSNIAALKRVDLTDGDEQVLEGYKNEIKFLQKLQGNRHIIKLMDFELKGHCLYLVMECGSSDLNVFLKTQSRASHSLNINEVKVLWINMLCAVQAIHKHGIIHLDLKPANFMMFGLTLKLIDFGIANSIQADATSVIKDTQFGTLNYMAPETINDMSGGMKMSSSYQPMFKVGPQADVWSLGCILYYIMYGKTPFQHIQNQAMKLFAITSDNHKIEFPTYPIRDFVEIAQACLIRDPKKRPSVDALLNHPMLS